MQRALELAANAKSSARPNPMVVCVIVNDDKIIGEGWTQPYGGPHAEVAAINSVKDKSLIAASTAYVTLEPCSHFGKTPPCADLLVSHQIQRVVVACKDSNALLAGKGIQKLKQSGVEVEEGLLEKEAVEFNKRFFTSIEKGRPYVILKWAETTDGFIARSNYDSKWISNVHSRKLVHQWRAEEAAIMVGTNTAKYDDPELNVRLWEGIDPIRIVIDKHLKLNKDLKLFIGDQPTICYNLIEDRKQGNTTFVKLNETNFLEELLADMNTKKIESVLVEGGAQLLQSFIDKNLWDEARIFIGPALFEEGIKAPRIKGPCYMKDKVFDDELKIIKNGESNSIRKI